MDFGLEGNVALIAGGGRVIGVKPAYQVADMLAQAWDKNQHEEVAAQVTFLCSNQAAFSNDEDVCPDAGRRGFYWGD